jgi:hypothetical protein
MRTACSTRKAIKLAVALPSAVAQSSKSWAISSGSTNVNLLDICILRITAYTSVLAVNLLRSCINSLLYAANSMRYYSKCKRKTTTVSVKRMTFPVRLLP